jgi:RHS repeat-associated protein
MSFNEGVGLNIQPYKYNGKELDQMHGLNLYDYSARYYEPAIGRFTTVDPLAEKYYSISPYAYCNNNPLKFIDPTGMSYTYNWNTGMYENGDGDNVPFGEVLDWIRDKSNKVTGTVNYISEKATGLAVQATAAAQDFAMTIDFATGSGSDHYELDANNYSTKSLKGSYLTTTALEKFLDELNKHPIKNSFTFDIGFSPFSDAKVGPFNSIIKDKGYSTAQFVGSCSYNFEIKGSQVEITVNNITSLNSALYHIPFIGKPSREDTPFGFGGNVSQNYHFTMSMNEIQQRVAKK